MVETFFIARLFGFASVHRQLTIRQVEDAVVQLEARARERHLGRHDNSHRGREQEEALDVGLQTSRTAEPERRDRCLNSVEIAVVLHFGGKKKKGVAEEALFECQRCP